MRRTILPLVLCFSMLLTGCQSWNVNAFGVDIHRPADAPAPRALGFHASDPGYEPLSKDEKTGVIVVVGLAVALAVAGFLVFN